MLNVRVLLGLALLCSCSAARHDRRSAISKEYTKNLREGIAADLRSRRTVDIARYECDNCLYDEVTGKALQVRLLFIESKDIVENEAAERAAIQSGTNHTCGSCCSDPKKAVPECFVAENWITGWMAKPLLEVLAKTGAEIIAMTPANFTDEARSMAPEGHPFSICPFEVLTENVDVCVGDFWETLFQRNIVPFTTPFEINTFKLVTLAVDQEDFTPIHLLDMFKPFSSGVWTMMLGMFVFTAILMWIVSEDDSEEFEEDELFPHKRGLVKGIWVSTMGYLAGNQFSSNKWSARFIVMGFSFFLATTVAAYTANLASFMVQAPKDIGKVTGLADIVARKKTLCTVSSVKNMLTEPGIQDRLLIEQSGFMGSMFELLKAGKCDAALVGSMEFLLYVQAGTAQYDICTTAGDANYLGGFFCAEPQSSLTRYDLTECQCGSDRPLYDVAPANCPAHCVTPHSKFCDVIEVLDPTLAASFNYALPAAAWIEPFISSGIIASKVSGQYFQDYKEELIATNPPSCPTGSPQGRINNAQLTSAISLGITFMSGTFFFSSIVMGIGILLHIGVKVYARRFGSGDEDMESSCNNHHASAKTQHETPIQQPAMIASSAVETFRDGVDELKQTAFKLQAEESMAGMNEKLGHMEHGYRLVQRELTAVLDELSTIRSEQQHAREKGGTFRFSKSGRVPGGTFKARAAGGSGVAGGSGKGGYGDSVRHGEQGHQDHAHHKAHHHRVRR